MFLFFRKSRSARSAVGFLLLFCAGQLAAQTPVITTLSPTSAVPGSSLTISGNDFNPSPGSNAVYIGGVRATVTAASATSLTVTVPTGATYGRVSVVDTATGLIDVSPQMFLPTFTPTLGRALEASDFVMTSTTGVAAYALSSLDLNADGKLDIVLTTAVSDAITYRLNTSTPGSIAFGAESSFTVPGFVGMEDNEMGDLDGDGLMDIVATSMAADKFVVLRQSAPLTFAQTAFDTGDEPLSLALIDVDNDGKLDVVVAHDTAAVGVHVYRNTTVGSTISFAAAVTFTGTIGAGVSMTAADFNADGKDDVIVARNSPRSVAVMENSSSGPGNVAFTTTVTSLGTDSFPNFVTTAELDGDGKIDLVVPFGATAATTAGILANTSAANVSFSSDFTTLASVGANQNTAAVGDLTGDGKVDVVLPMAKDEDATGAFLYRTAVYTNTSTSGAIGFAPKLEMNATGMTVPPNETLVADLDGDNRPDLLVYHRTTGRMAFYRNAPVFAPTTQATNVTVSSATLWPTQAEINWTRGSGQRVVVFMKQTGSTSDVPAPVDRTTYSVSSSFGSGSQIGTSGWYAVATGTGTSATVTGLAQNTAYRVTAVEYSNNATDGAEVYQIATATGNPLNFTTPAPVAITSLARAAASPTNAAVVAYTLTLDGNVYAGMTAARFSLTTTGTIAGASIASVTGTGSSFTVNVNTGTGNGNITLNLNNQTNVVPGISNTLPFAGETYVVDRAAAGLSAVTIESDNADPGVAYVGSTVTLNFTAAEAITPTVSIAGHPVTATNTGGFNWTATYTLTAMDTLGAVPFEIAFTDALGNPGTNVTSTSDASAVVLEIPVSAPPAETLIQGSHSGVDLTGPLHILGTAVIDGGRLTGDIYNSGLITGTITLGPGTTIHGGTVSGTIKGDPSSPALLLAVTIPENTVLEHVIIGSGTVLSANAVIGAGVRFESRNLIPPGLDLTGALNAIRWSGSSELTVVDLGSDVLRIPTRTILEALQLLAGQQGSELDPATGGELTLSVQNSRGMLLPVRVRQAARDAAPGTYVDGDANIVFVTAEGYEVVMYPVLLADAFFADVLAASGLGFDYDAQGRIIVEPPHGRFRYVGRAAAAAVPAPEGSMPGLHARDSDYVLVFHDADGALMEQELVPVPADWPNLRAALAALPGVSDVTIDVDGTLAVAIDGRRVRGRMAHQAGVSTVNFLQGEAYLGWAGDLNGDGTGDYHVFYPRQSLVQVLYVNP